jgi:uncharacterized protein YerC
VPKILRSGRLGNQLFHYAYAHWILSSGESDPDYQVKLLVKSNDEEKLNFLRGSCKHIELATLSQGESTELRIYSKLDSQLRKLKRNSGISRQFLDREERSIGYTDSRYKIGYFQKYEYPNSVSNLIKHELFNSLKEIIIPLWMQVSLKHPFQVLHVRRGDFLDPSNVGFGLLASEWYLKNKVEGLPIILVTDDPAGASQVIADLRPDLVLGPTQADEYQVLRIMSESVHLVAANSTLSWWGGFLAHHSGAKVVYPRSEIEFHRDINNPDFQIEEGIYLPRT